MQAYPSRSMHSSRSVGALVVVLLSLAGPARSYPVIFVADTNGCSTAAPTRGEGAHGAPRADPTTAFEITAGGEAVTALCTGKTYDVEVTFPERRNALITASQGALSGGEPEPTGEPCTKRAFTGSPDKSFTFKYTAPPSSAAAGASVVLASTSATGMSGDFLTASTTLPLGACSGAAPASGAAAAAVVKPAAAAAAASPAPGPAEGEGDGDDKGGTRKADGSLRDDDDEEDDNPTPGAAPAAAAAANTTCAASSLGYQCQFTDPATGLVLHYTQGGALPDNACTSGVSAAGANAAAADADMLHLAVQSPLAGFVSLAFPQRVGVMSPADAVIGYVDASGPKVSTYALSGYSAGDDTTDTNWAVNRGVVRSNGVTTLCFSRPLTSRVALASSQVLDASAVHLHFAASDSSDLSRVHMTAGGLSLDTASGGVGGVVRADSDSSMYTAHGALMLAAFGGLMPLGALLARHKWAFGRKQGGVSPIWYFSHIGVQLVAVAAAVSSIVIIFVYAGTDDPGISLWRPHQVIGLIAVSMAVVQLAIGFVRPQIGAPTRKGWNFLHHNWGRLALLLGWVDLFLGVVLVHDLKGASLTPWLVATVVLVGVMILAFLVLEFVKLRLERGGVYDPSSHAWVPGLPVNGVNASKHALPATDATNGSAWEGPPPASGEHK